MEIDREKYYEDEEGYKKETIFRSGLKETIHLECSPKYIRKVIRPQIDASNRQREIIRKEEKIREKMREIAIREIEKERR